MADEASTQESVIPWVRGSDPYDSVRAVHRLLATVPELGLVRLVELAVNNGCRIRVGDIEVEPLSDAHPGLAMLPHGITEVSENDDEPEDPDADRFAHTGMRPPNLKGLRGEGGNG